MNRFLLPLIVLVSINATDADAQVRPGKYSIRSNVSDGIQNLRSGPGQRHSVVVAIPAGASDVTIGQCRSADDALSQLPWCQARWKSYSGWISSCCLVAQATTTGSKPTATAEASNTSRPSFSCNDNLAPDEITICSSETLSLLDRQLSKLFTSALQALDADKKVEVRNEQRAWLAQRSNCRRDERCITRAYQLRIGQLQGGGGTPQGQAKSRNQQAPMAQLTLVPDMSDQLLEKCRSSCPGDPAANKLRDELQEQMGQENLSAHEAQAFTVAIGDPQKLSAYISSCKKCEFRDDANRELAALRKVSSDSGLADREKNQYNAARGNIQALKRYIAACQVCAFGNVALQEINQSLSNYAEPLFKLEVCNNDHLPVYVAYAGKPDPNSDMWITGGWYNIESGTCSTIATLTKGNFYVSAHNKRAVWTGDETQGYCTPNEAFARILLPHGDACSEEDYNKFW